MIVWEDIITELTAETVTKINREPNQSNINLLENDLAEHATKIKTTEWIVKQGKNYGFLIIVIGLTQNRTIIKNPWTVWNEPEDPGLYNNSIAAMDTTFAWSKKEKTHFRKEKEYEKYLRVTESIQTLLQAVDEPYLEALKQDYIGYDGVLPTTMIHHLQKRW